MSPDLTFEHVQLQKEMAIVLIKDFISHHGPFTIDVSDMWNPYLTLDGVYADTPERHPLGLETKPRKSLDDLDFVEIGSALDYIEQQTSPQEESKASSASDGDTSYPAEALPCWPVSVQSRNEDLAVVRKVLKQVLQEEVRKNPAGLRSHLYMVFRFQYQFSDTPGAYVELCLFEDELVRMTRADATAPSPREFVALRPRLLSDLETPYLSMVAHQCRALDQSFSSLKAHEHPPQPDAGAAHDGQGPRRRLSDAILAGLHPGQPARESAGDHESANGG